MSTPTTAPPSLQAFLDAFNARDVGKQQVREGIQARFDGIPDIRYEDDRHWICGDRGVSQWTIRGTQASGERIEVCGCDLLEFSGGKISRKDSYWKIVD